MHSKFKRICAYLLLGLMALVFGTIGLVPFLIKA
jgi:hypothetical protein